VAAKKKRESEGVVQRRQVGISICAPVFATVIVKRSSPDQEWEVESVRRVDCDLSARGVEEHAKDDDLAEMDRLANEAEDLP
jgi:hypothetical protein